MSAPAPSADFAEADAWTLSLDQVEISSCLKESFCFRLISFGFSIIFVKVILLYFILWTYTQ